MGLATLLILTVTDSCNNQLKMRSLIIIITASLLSCNQKPKESPSASFEKDLEVLKEYNASVLPTYIAFTPNVGSEDLFTIQERTQGQSSVFGYVKFKPLRNPSTAQDQGIVQQFDYQINFIDIAE